MSIYGWILWSKNKEDNTHVKIEYATRKDWIFCIFLFITSIIFVTLVYYYKPLLDNQFILKNTKLGLQYLDWANWLDILTTALFLIGMYLMANRKIENWIFWIIADIISVPMLIYKELIITSFQFFIFTIMAIIGYISWKKTLNSPIKKIV